MTITVIRLAYNASFAIDPKDASTLLAIFARSKRIDDRYLDNVDGSVWVEEKDQRVTIQMENGTILTRGQYDEMRAKADAARAAKEAAETAGEVDAA